MQNLGITFPYGLKRFRFRWKGIKQFIEVRESCINSKRHILLSGCSVYTTPSVDRYEKCLTDLFTRVRAKYVLLKADHQQTNRTPDGKNLRND
jgi:hypothetical protein